MEAGGSDSVALVRRAIDDHGFIKEAGRQLALYDPCPEAARVLVASYRSGESPGYLVAYLLGQGRHADGYETAREILEADEQQLSESYAAVAMARIDPGRALGDFVAVLQKTTSGAVRRGVASGLGAIGATAKDVLVSAVADGLLREKTAAWELSRVSVSDDELKTWLLGEPVLARLAIEVLAERARRRPPLLRPGRALREVASTVAERVCVLDGPVRLIRDWFDEGPGRAESMLAVSMTGDVNDLDLTALEALIHRTVRDFAPGWPAEDGIDGVLPSFHECDRGRVVIGGLCVVICHDFWTPFFASFRASPELDGLAALTVKVGAIDLESGAVVRHPDHVFLRDDVERVIWCHVVERTQQSSAAWSRRLQNCERCGEKVFSDATLLGQCPSCANIGCEHWFFGGRCVQCFERE